MGKSFIFYYYFFKPKVVGYYLLCAGSVISYGRKRSAALGSFLQCPVGGQSELGRGSYAVLFKLPGFTLCHFEENRSTLTSCFC